MPSVIKGDSNVNLDFSTGGRITGDFSNATHANRVLFQTSTVNGSTIVGVVPNGTSTTAQLNLYNNSDPTNTGLLQALVGTGEVSVRSGITGTGTYLPMTFWTGGSERMRVTSDGNVGIGTSSPTYKLDVSGNGRVTGDFYVGASTNIIYESSSNLNVRAANALLFLTSGANERARIDTSGNLLVNTTSSYVSGSSARVQIAYPKTSQWAFFIRPTDNNTGGGGPVLFQNLAGTTIGSISADASNVAYNTSSDYRLKYDIAPMTGALARVAALKPCTYKWKADGSDGEGFIAHELAEVCPRAVSGEKDAVNEDGSIKPQGIDTSFLVATLTAAIQELNAKVESLTAEIATLKGAQA